ncbi:hypothetical protein G6F56_002825 [Rhizopus delemar]|uniref:Split finger protein n=1 Tax=Rhizopus stolonifer TaxID=4846 RepID=A0A367KF94_RHIST|nr:hypothetical protein G6F56_002825 [Rhizopus delemar]RCI00886.1 split finger protein [Rhizopus stolonifer]
MPVPVENTFTRRMSTITIPKQDINFDTYDFQLCQPQTNIEGAFESRELEASFCRDFECCGLVLDDLHDLLQHYEECHVRVEDEDNSSFFETSSEDACWSSNSSMVDEEEQSMDSLKRKAAAYLSDLPQEEEKKKKRSYSNAFDLLTQSAAKKIALASGETLLLNDEDFLAQAGALLASAQHNHNSNADKPYKCPVGGCDKAYKNPNGLKYHSQHGHCNMSMDENESIASKPYQCTIGECGKRYKNLNGLKYHIEHSHMAALNHTLATFGSSIFNSSFEPSSLDDITSTTSTLF